MSISWAKARRHAPALGLAVLTGAITLLPHAVAGFRTPYHQFDEGNYAAFVETVRQGTWTYSDCFVWEHREDPWPYPRFPFWLLGAAARITSTEAVFRWSDAFLPPVLFLLAYGIFQEVRLGRILSMLGASVFVLHYGDLSACLDPLTRRDVLEVARWWAFPALYGQTLPGATLTARLPDPLLSKPVLLAAVWATLRAVTCGRRRTLIVAATLTGMTVYMRFFDWTVLLPALGIALVHLGLTRRRTEAVRLAWILGGAAVIGSPYFVSNFSNEALAAREGSLVYSEFVRTRRLFPDVLQDSYPVGPICLLAVGVACGVLARRHPLARAGAWYAVACAAAVGHQVLTGWTIAPTHWYGHHVFPAFCVMVVLMLGACLSRWGSSGWKRGAPIGLLVLSFAHAAQQYAVPTRIAPEFGDDVELRDALALNGPDAVVMTLAPTELRRLDGRAWSFLPWTPYSTAPTEELIERLLLACRLWGVPASGIEGLFDGPHTSGLVHFVKRIDDYRFRPIRITELRMGGIVGIWLPARDRSRWLSFFEGLPTDRLALVARIRERYRLDCVLITPEVRRIADTTALEADPRFTVVRETERFTLLRVP